MRTSILATLAFAAACGSSTPADPAPVADVADTAASEDIPPPPPTHLDSLDVCWSDVGCPRAFVISHGGEWDGDNPYDSKGAFERAWTMGADGIKTDLLVTKDNVAVVAHSSPIEPWESDECKGRKIEEMTADEVTACVLFPSEAATYQRVDDVLEWARGKLTIMLTVKDSSAFARAISTVLEHDAADFVYIETRMDNLENAVIQSPDWEKLRYNAEIGSLAELDALEKAVALPRVLFCEFAPPEATTDLAPMTDAIAKRLHPLGIRSFTSSIKMNSVEQHAALYDAGIDVIMSYVLANGVEARIAANTARGVKPP